MKKCVKCGAELRDRDEYCPACGAKQDGSMGDSPEVVEAEQVKADEAAKYRKNSRAEVETIDEVARIFAIIFGILLIFTIIVPIFGFITASKLKKGMEKEERLVWGILDCFFCGMVPGVLLIVSYILVDSND